jgi:hypothetical protein
VGECCHPAFSWRCCGSDRARTRRRGTGGEHRCGKRTSRSESPSHHSSRTRLPSTTRGTGSRRRHRAGSSRARHRNSRLVRHGTNGPGATRTLQCNGPCDLGEAPLQLLPQETRDSQGMPARDRPAHRRRTGSRDPRLRTSLTAIFCHCYTCATAGVKNGTARLERALLARIRPRHWPHKGEIREPYR